MDPRYTTLQHIIALLHVTDRKYFYTTTHAVSIIKPNENCRLHVNITGKIQSVNVMSNVMLLCTCNDMTSLISYHLTSSEASQFLPVCPPPSPPPPAHSRWIIPESLTWIEINPCCPDVSIETILKQHLLYEQVPNSIKFLHSLNSMS